MYLPKKNGLLDESAHRNYDGPPSCIMCVQYRGGCTVPWGYSIQGECSTVGGVQYRGGIQYCGDIMSTVGGYHEYHGGIS